MLAWKLALTPARFHFYGMVKNREGSFRNDLLTSDDHIDRAILMMWSCDLAIGLSSLRSKSILRSRDLSSRGYLGALITLHRSRVHSVQSLKVNMKNKVVRSVGTASRPDRDWWSCNWPRASEYDIWSGKEQIIRILQLCPSPPRVLFEKW